MKSILFLLLLCVLIFLSGCTYYVEEPIPASSTNTGQGSTLHQSPTPTVSSVDILAAQQTPSVDNTKELMFTNAGQNKQSGLEYAVEWSAKYEKAAARVEEVETAYREMQDENARLKAQILTMQAELEQTNLELKEADKFMRAMEQDMSIWKTDMVNYREENRRVQKAQLQALSKILKALGAEDSSDTN